MNARLRALLACLIALLFVPAALLAKDEGRTKDPLDVLIEKGAEKSAAAPKEGAQKEGVKSSGKKPAAPAKEAAHRHREDTHAAAAVQGGHEEGEVSPEQALRKLLDGNQRYVAGKTTGPNRTVARRSFVAKGQKPFAVILGCSDSRVPPEVLFDQGLGDLFVIRNAGNVADPVVIGSIEYAVEHLGVHLIMVLGHKKCGAVDATVKGGEAPGSIKSIVEKIQPAVEKAKLKQGDLLANSVKSNVKMVAEQLIREKPILAHSIEEGELKVVGAYYDLDTGAVAVTYNPCTVLAPSN
ncbi:MAG: carbonic anhydrase [Thermodesulfovibrionales bacterium]